MLSRRLYFWRRGWKSNPYKNQPYESCELPITLPRIKLLLVGWLGNAPNLPRFQGGTVSMIVTRFILLIYYIKKHLSTTYLYFLVRQVGIKPTTFWLKVRYSINWITVSFWQAGQYSKSQQLVLKTRVLPIELPTLIIYLPYFIPLFNFLVEPERIELSTMACKTIIFPLNYGPIFILIQ